MTTAIPGAARPSRGPRILAFVGMSLAIMVAVVNDAPGLVLGLAWAGWGAALIWLVRAGSGQASPGDGGGDGGGGGESGGDSDTGGDSGGGDGGGE